MAEWITRNDATNTTTYVAPCMHCCKFMSGSKPLPRYHPACAEFLETRAIVDGMHEIVIR